MRLPINDQRIDTAADVINRRVSREFNGAGIGVNLYLTDCGAIREDLLMHLIIGRGRYATI
jgi:hypothetical protein